MSIHIDKGVGYLRNKFLKAGALPAWSIPNPDTEPEWVSTDKAVAIYTAPQEQPGDLADVLVRAF